MIKEIVEYIVKQLVDNPDQVEILVIETDEKCMLEIKVNEHDRGKIIGRQGQTIKALRALISASIPTDKIVQVDIIR